MIRRLFACLVVALGFAIMAPGAAFAQKRMALVIGNNSYGHLASGQQLTNAVSDARAVKTALEKLGFDVKIGENLDRAAFIEKLSEFGAQLHEGDIAFFFYAGHGVSLNGANYMLPSDIPPVRVAGLNEEERLADLSVAETRVHDRIKRSGVRLAVVVLDACRDNPFASNGRSIGNGRGLVTPPETRGVISIYSAGIGQQALDSLGDDDRDPNSVFTRVFVQKLVTPGLGLRQLAFDTQAEVVRLASNNGADQTPGVYSQIIGEDVFLAGKSAPGNNDGLRPAVDPDAAAHADFDIAQKIGTLAAWDAFLAHHPSGFLADLGRGERQKLAMLTPPARLPATGPCGGATLAALSSRSAAALTAQEECALKPKDVFKECEHCPEMVVVPSGSFTMGSPASEPGRNEREGPQHLVTIGKPFAVGRFTVTRDEFATFIAETGYDAGSKCYIWRAKGWQEKAGASWRNPGYEQTGSHPVTCVNWNDAQAYMNWLKKKTGKDYRLPSEAEWEYAARSRTNPGNYPRYFFGDDEKDMCGYGNGADQTAQRKIAGAKDWSVLPCSDGYAFTSPVGSFQPNAFGLYDMHGNVWQWVEDCYVDNYRDASSDGRAKTTGDCVLRVLRGGSWFLIPRDLRAAIRDRGDPGDRGSGIGFRLARTIMP